MSDYIIQTLNQKHWNEFEHREVVFTRLKTIGDGLTRPISQVLQIWDKETDSLIIELVLKESLNEQL